jgi:two-component system, chemotaxis family, protein-glutamate methylesterase/glutaminase
MAEPARVLIVDDSRIFRAALERSLEKEKDITVVGSVHSGEKALEFIRATPLDVVTLDVEMPGMDGLQTLREIERLDGARPDAARIGIIMVSAFTKRGADVTVQALRAGAFDFITKPSTPDEATSQAQMRHQLAGKIRLYMARRPHGAPGAASSRPGSVILSPRDRPVRAILIAASTGGPRALEMLLPDLCRRVETPILIVQHMPAQFTLSLAENFARVCDSDVVEASDGEPFQPKTIYIAPGGKHLLLRADGGRVVTSLNEQPPENGCRPSADVLFRSAASVLGGEVAAIVLTGMGADGTAGLRPLKRAGGFVIAQDEATSVVWGMPGSAVTAGLADEVLPLEKIAAAISVVIQAGGRR